MTQAQSEENASLEKAKKVFRRHGGVLRTSEAIRFGIHPRTLYAMRDAGVLECLSRGLYRLSDLPPLGSPDLVAVALKVPAGVICLISALAYHELTTQIPHEVYLALPRGAEPPRLDYPPIRIFWFTGKDFAEGIDTHEVDEYWKYYRNKPQAGTWRAAMQELATSVEDTLGIPVLFLALGECVVSLGLQGKRPTLERPVTAHWAF